VRLGFLLQKSSLLAEGTTMQASSKLGGFPDEGQAAWSREVDTCRDAVMP
jgi:hypothetical protein